MTDGNRRIAVVGSLNADLVLDVPQLPATGETVLAGGVRRFAGGKGANQAVALARLGAHVMMYGHVGDDDEGRMLRSALAAAGVDATSVTTSPTSPTGMAIVTVSQDADNSIVVVSGANSEVDAATVGGVGADGAVVAVVAQLEIPIDAVDEAFSRARQHGARTFLNAAPATPLPDFVLANSDVVIVNELEAAALATPAEAADMACELRDRGPGIVVVTLGDRGCVVAHEAGCDKLDAHKVTAIDTTGAGDCFVAAFVCELSSDGSPVEAARFASASSAVAVTRRGTQDAMPSRREVDAFLASQPPAAVHTGS